MYDSAILGIGARDCAGVAVLATSEWTKKSGGFNKKEI